MKKLTTQHGRRLIFWVALLGTVLVVALKIIDPVGKTQRRNMHLAKTHGEMLLKQLADNPEFVHVHFIATTSEDLTLVGYVASSNVLAQLRKIVDEGHSPRPVNWRVKIEPLLFETTK